MNGNRMKFRKKENRGVFIHFLLFVNNGKTQEVTEEGDEEGGSQASRHL